MKKRKININKILPHISVPDADLEFAEVTELGPPVPAVLASEAPDTPSADIFRGSSVSSLGPGFASKAEVGAGAEGDAIAASEPGIGISRLPLAL